MDIALTKPSAGTNRLSELFIPLSIGFIAFALFTNINLLDPTHISWMLSSDPSSNYIGWRFFVDGPWSLPPGANPDYGLELSRSIVYADGIPLMALFFKLFSPILPENFHYFGWWILLIFMLQAVFAWKLIGLFSKNTWILILGSAIFCCAPALLHRLMSFGTTMHIALSSHFLILATLYLHFRTPNERKINLWLALIAASLLIHFYLFAMVAIFWFFSLEYAQRVQNKEQKSIIIEFGLAALLVITLGWLSGYFVGSGASSDGFGFFRANLLSLFDADDWSAVLPDLPSKPLDYEGFSYLGLGMIAGLATAVIILLAGRVKISKAPIFHWMLILPIALTALFALSNNIGLGAMNVHIPLPDIVLKVANVARSSGRFMWPLMYVIMLSTIYIIVKGLSQRAAIVALGGILVLQIADTSVKWTSDQNPLSIEASSDWPTGLNDPFWQEVPKYYSKIRTTKPGNAVKGWKEFSMFALQNNMRTNTPYLSRLGLDAVTSSEESLNKQVTTGNYDSDTLYIVDESHIDLARESLETGKDALLLVDGWQVIAPGWMNKTAQ